MTCEEFLRLLSDERPMTNPETAAHAASCPTCARELERWQAVQHELRALRSEAPPPFLHTRIMATVRSGGDAPERLTRRLLGPRTLLASAAVVLLASLVGYQVMRQHGTPATRQIRSEPSSRTGPSARTATVAGEAAKKTEAMVARPVGGSPHGSANALGAAPQKGVPPASRRDQLASDAWAPQPRSEGAPALREPAQAAAPAPQAIGNITTNQIAAGSQESRRSAATADGARPAAARVETGTVSCEFRAVATGNSLFAGLPARSAPPPFESWTITVANDGSARVVDAHGTDLTPLVADLRNRIRILALAPGRYTLTRRTE